MTPDEYRQACNLARRAVASQRPYLSPEDVEDACQEAALAVWQGRHGWWAAFDEATRLQGGRRKVQPTLVPIDGLTAEEVALDCVGWLRASDDPEGEALSTVTVERIGAALPEREWRAVEATVLLGRPWAEICGEWGVPDGTVTRWRRRGLEKARRLVEATT